ncbi:MAG: aminotransferase class V-fold PLP-dependent enzyme [Haliscomenobacter sp.]|nr:aminotransferase class V-fold PLP-dependent enzyme [Haliscomenobacter sp.]
MGHLRFSPGDEIITFTHEYPADYYPWVIQELKGVSLKLIPNRPARSDIDPGLVGWFSIEDLEELITPRTRIIALSHVQFTSGFAADLQAIGALCKERGIDFIVDAAQSLGSMPLCPENGTFPPLPREAGNGSWALGVGVFYTSPPFATNWPRSPPRPPGHPPPPPGAPPPPPPRPARARGGGGPPPAGPPPPGGNPRGGGFPAPRDPRETNPSRGPPGGDRGRGAGGERPPGGGEGGPPPAGGGAPGGGRFSEGGGGGRALV